MIVHSTRGASSASLSEAIAQGLAPDGGLYMPPQLPPRAIDWGSDLRTRATNLLAPYFADDALSAHLPAIVAEAFNFDAPLRWLDERTALLELFHGPTAAFKDFGARFLAATLARLVPRGVTTTVLVATSGDTGAAVASAWSASGCATPGRVIQASCCESSIAIGIRISMRARAARIAIRVSSSTRRRNYLE
jgi:threonine synthase